MNRLLFIPAIAIMLGGCSVAQKAVDQVTQTAEEAAVEQAVRANCKYEKDVCDFFATQAKMMQQSVSMKTTYVTNEKSLQGQETVTKMDGKGNLLSTSYQNGKETNSMIILNNATYMKDAKETVWLKMSSGNEDDTSVFNTKAMLEDMQETFSEDNTELKVTKVGQEACGNLTCNIFEMVDEASKEFGTTKVWVDTKDSFTRKMEFKGSDTTTTVISYTYEPVTITEPSPVKEFEMPKVPALQEGSMPSAEEIQQMMQDLPNPPTEE